MTEALTDRDFAALMAPLGPWPGDRRVAAAVSGGADSMALAALLARWGRPLALVVDHGLRPASAAEAALTATRLAALGVPAQVLHARLAPGPAAAERARAARYDLLLAACAAAGRPDLLLAHHADDQAETVRLREEVGGFGPGSAAMAAIAFRPDARLVRPLLTVPRARLRATARAERLHWVEDPTNADPRTARGRLRAAPAPTASSELGAALRRAVEGRVADELAAAIFAPEGFALLPAGISPDALSAVIWAVSGRPYPPPRAALARGLEPRTVSGVLIRPRRDGAPGAAVLREPAAVAPPAPARPGMLWDGRWRIPASPAAVPQHPDALCGPLGAAAARFRRASPLPSDVLRTLPAFWRDDTLLAVPHLGFPDRQTCRSLTPWFCPARPATGALFVPAPVNPLEGPGV